MAAAEPGQLEFRGEDATECELFINAVSRHALSIGKQRDDQWVADFASSCFTHDALRWWNHLDDATQGSWRSLRNAMLLRYRPSFHGRSGEEAEKFVRMVRERAFDEGKQNDNDRIIGFISTCFVGDALRWHALLESHVQNDWTRLQAALLAQYPRDPQGNLSNLIPTPAAAVGTAATPGIGAVSVPRTTRRPPPIPAAQSIPRVGFLSYLSLSHNKAAAGRKARAEAQHAPAQSAITIPRRAGGKTHQPKPKGAWRSDSEEEEDDDDDEDSDGPLPGKSRSGPGSSQYHSAGPSMALSSSQHIYEARRPAPPTARYETSPTGRPLPSPDYASQQRGGRNLPVALTSRSPSVGPHRDLLHPSQYDAGHYGEQPPNVHRDLSPAARGCEMPPQLRQNIWSQALDPNQDHPTPSGRETFITVEDEAETMTKVFAPQGLLQAGVQGHDRSAKRREEMARESGTSLINVPNKPLDPQTGLLGAVTAHERERKREAGVGATLTRKLADERMAEERQRKLDELQRQQLDYAMGNGASMYDPYGRFQNPMMTAGGQFGYNPMMMNPMLMGNPMMGNPMMGNPMMGMGMGMNPQQMMAAQAAAAEAYQRATTSSD
ncbi:hypothetical protein FRC04_002237 [Tulasnella sp. 424]|nr:hypothetical protein FRC04_002237 [Tulasnella sp. 424]KAG8969715.1 hypothetical protein FRC05_000846 [Tulasnella sp. 425]